MLLPFDSTIKANISVGPPIDFQIYEADSFHTGPNGRFHKDDPYLLEISNGWGRALNVTFDVPNKLTPLKVVPDTMPSIVLVILAITSCRPCLRQPRHV